MTGSRNLTLNRVASSILILLLLAGPAPIASAVGSPTATTPEWNGQGIDSDGEIENPASIEDPSSGGASEVGGTMVYEARVACTEGDVMIFTACTQVVADCAKGVGSPDGEPGTVIYWYFADRHATPRVWSFFSGPECVFGEKPRDVLAEIAGMIQHEFQRSPVLPAVFGSQPGPHTLRGKETNVWAEAQTQTFNLSLVGQQVTITATPVAYTWDYGDGTVWGPTPVHGAPLHEDRIGEQTRTSHVYAATGRLSIGLTTHFDGSYSVNGGPQLPIPGQGHIASAPIPLTVWRAETHLYADNCFQNPQGKGCN